MQYNRDRDIIDYIIGKGWIHKTNQNSERENFRSRMRDSNRQQVYNNCMFWAMIEAEGEVRRL